MRIYTRLSYFGGVAQDWSHDPPNYFTDEYEVREVSRVRFWLALRLLALSNLIYKGANKVATFPMVHPLGW